MNKINKIKSLRSDEVFVEIDIIFDYATVDETVVGILTCIKEMNDKNCECYVLEVYGPGGGATLIGIKGHKDDIYDILRNQDYEIDYAFKHEYPVEKDKEGLQYMVGDGFIVYFSPLNIV